ncbi:MAG: hypothetical protein KME13_21280, partial [Myxacorys californica WJT36-NPBG1]|nr:hypothetical protein [Myxacorys californica WJT36-NPBG1]
KHHLAIHHKRTYRQSKANEVWYLLTSFVGADKALFHYDFRFCIEPMFRDLKSGGYNLEDCHACKHRFTALLVLIAIAYSISTVRGQRIRTKQVQYYVD